MRDVITSPHAPPAIGPYSQGVRAGGLIFLSGQIPLVRDTGNFVEGAIKEQTEQVITNIKALLATQRLADMADFQAMNEVYANHFHLPAPARSTVQVARLPRDARVEIEVIAQARD